MLECKQLEKKYHNLIAVDHVSLSFEPGKIYALLGPNGSGKSTFMKIAAGLIKPTAGEILFNGKPIGIESKAHTAYMPTENYFYSYMTAKDIGMYYQDFFSDFDRNKFEQMLKQMELPLQLKATKMSSGMFAKLKIAVALSRNANLIMLDEPLNGIDIIAREHVLTSISENFSPDKTFVISSHLVDELEPMIDSVIFMKHGHIELMGEKAEICDTYCKSIVDLYKEIYADCQY